MPWIAVAAALVAALLTSCATPGSPGADEAARRDELERAAAEYRPDGRKPALPVLTADSTRDDFAAYAVLASPRVAEAFHAWERAVHEIVLARSLPDPSLSLEIEIERTIEAIRPGVLGAFPGPGKRALAAEAQSAAAAARRHEFEQAAATTAVRAQVAWLRAAWLSEVLAVRREVLDLLRGIEDLASAQFRVGRVSQQDVLRVQIERDELENTIASLEDSRNLILAEVRAALGIPPGDPPPPLPERLPPPTTAIGSEDDLLARALVGNHALLALREEMREAESMLALARKADEPDYMLGLKVDLLGPVFMPEVGATLPVWRDKITATVAAALASRHAADARFQGGVLDVVVLAADAHFRFREARRRLDLIVTKLLPKADAARESARGAYATGLVDLTGLLDAERSLLGFRLERATAQLELEAAAAEIRLLVVGGE